MTSRPTHVATHGRTTRRNLHRSQEHPMPSRSRQRCCGLGTSPGLSHCTLLLLQMASFRMHRTCIRPSESGQSPLHRICSRVCCRTSGSPNSTPVNSTFRRAVSLTVVDSARVGACSAAGCSLFRPWTLHDMMAGFSWAARMHQKCYPAGGYGQWYIADRIDPALGRTSSVVRLDRTAR